MGVSAQLVIALANATSQELGLRRITTGCMLHGIAQACDPDVMGSARAQRLLTAAGESPAELAAELAALRSVVARSGLDPDVLHERMAQDRHEYRRAQPDPDDDADGALELHSQATLVFGAASSLAEADPRAGGDLRAEHQFRAVLVHPTGDVHAMLARFGLTLLSARDALDVPGDEWEVGEIVAQLYEVREVIRTGGMGVVYRVLHRGWNMELAVKAPRRELVDSPGGLRAFEIEAETWVGLGVHPNTVTCAYVRRFADLPRVFAEWLDGGSLADAVHDRRLYAGGHRAALARILDVAIQSAWGLEHAHASGLVHQDVKPANVLLGSDGSVKVTDFGLAGARAAAGESGPAPAGASILAAYGGMTPAYCSPEQALSAIGEPAAVRAGITRATDVWSWGLTVLEMFTGEHPTQLGAAAGTVLAAFRVQGQSDRRIPPLPGKVARLLARCFDPNSATRPHGMAQLADELAGLYLDLLGEPYPRPQPTAVALPVDGLTNQALSLHDLGLFEEAEDMWLRALETDPHHPYAMFDLGLYLWRAERLTDVELIGELATARAEDPDDPVHDLLLGLVEVERGDREAARRLLGDLPARMPDDGFVVAARDLMYRTPLFDGQGNPAAGHSPTGRAPWAQPRPLRAVERARFRATLDGGDELVAQGRFREAAELLREARTVPGHARHPALLRRWRGLGQVYPRGALLGAWARRSVLILAREPGPIALTADGQLAVATGRDGTVGVYDTGTAQARRVLPGRFLATAPADRALVGDSDGQVRLVELGSGRVTMVLTGHAAPVDAAAVSADGAIGLTAASDGIRSWELASGRCLHATPARADAGLALTPDGGLALTAGVGEPLVGWEPRTGEVRGTIGGPGDLVALGPDGLVAVTAGSDGAVRLWELASLREQAAMLGEPGEVRHLSVTADGAVAVVSRADGAVQAWDLNTRALRHELPPVPSVRPVAMPSDGTFALVGDWKPLVWDLSSGVCSPPLDGAGSGSVAVALSADGGVGISAHTNGELRIWDLDWDLVLPVPTEPPPRN